MPDQGLLDVLRRSGGLVAVSQQLEITPVNAQAAVGALLPLVRGAFRRRVERAESREAGLSDLLTVLERLGGGSLASRVLQRDLADPTAGAAILREMFGPQEQQLVIADAAARSGAEPAVVEQVLPLLAMLAGGYVWARAGRMTANERLAELGPLLDLGGDANPLDAVSGIADH